MALTPMDSAQIQRAINVCKNLVENINPVLAEFDVWYNTASIGAKARLVDGDLATPYSGLTKSQLDDGLFALTSTLKSDMATILAALSQMATRAS